jgi:hypothetical protein
MFGMSRLCGYGWCGEMISGCNFIIEGQIFLYLPGLLFLLKSTNALELSNIGLGE